MGSLLVCVEKITFLTSRHALHEIVFYQLRETTQFQNLQDSLVQLYTKLLKLLVYSYRIFVKNTMARVAHAVVSPAGITELLSECDEFEKRVETDLRNCEMLRGYEIEEGLSKLMFKLANMNSSYLRTDENVEKLFESVSSQDCLTILDWVSRVLFGTHHDTIIGKRTGGTCQWLLEHETYRQWKTTSSSNILWLHGTGKFSFRMW